VGGACIDCDEGYFEIVPGSCADCADCIHGTCGHGTCICDESFGVDCSQLYDISGVAKVSGGSFLGFITIFKLLRTMYIPNDAKDADKKCLVLSWLVYVLISWIPLSAILLQTEVRVF
jgi:hypothetical protein